jgi:protein CpxP
LALRILTLRYLYSLTVIQRVPIKQNYFLEKIMKTTKSTKTIFSTIAVCIVIAFANIASVNASDNDTAFDSPRVHGHKHQMKCMAKHLSLSEEQQVEIRAIKMQAKEQHQILRVSMKKFKMAEKKLLQTEEFDEQAFNALYEAYQPIFKELALIRVKCKHAVFNVLNAEQQMKWLKNVEHKKEHTKNKCG